MIPETKAEFSRKIGRRGGVFLGMVGLAMLFIQHVPKLQGLGAFLLTVGGAGWLLVWVVTIDQESAHPFRQILKGLIIILTLTAIAFGLLVAYVLWTGQPSVFSSG